MVIAAYLYRLRHICATQLINAGCRVTTIQKLLGHRRLNSTMIYARVHDRAVAEDYYAAMTVVESRVEVVSIAGSGVHQRIEDGRAQILGLVDRLADPKLSVKARLDLVGQMRLVLDQRLFVGHGPPPLVLSG